MNEKTTVQKYLNFKAWVFLFFPKKHSKRLFTLNCHIMLTNKVRYLHFQIREHLLWISGVKFNTTKTDSTTEHCIRRRLLYLTFESTMDRSFKIVNYCFLSHSLERKTSKWNNITWKQYIFIEMYRVLPYSWHRESICLTQEWNSENLKSGFSTFEPHKPNFSISESLRMLLMKTRRC